ncbi:hypothetical protein MTO98_07210 [Mucilaginibacter sp. SMC90]|uniref:hypothetical protein n=1 Tax=Mucilaginibacter sp. SMC90 TaxID=2929803 RepID=UPI001FB1B608|nr:hypothetical protein [Mucilaginibacter sp. SMC90]UOE50864.1 hypothetical protein MTO98_07210 [Mucilaginibacter sp. SMC90]
MTTTNFQLIPHKAAGIQIEPFASSSSFLLIREDLDNKQYLNINIMTAEVLRLIDGKTTVEQIAGCFNQKYNSDIPCDSFYNLLFDGELARLNIVSPEQFSDEPASAVNISPFKRKDKYLILKIKLLNKDWVHRLSQPFKFLFQKASFYQLMLGMLVFLSFFFLTSNLGFDQIRFYLSSHYSFGFLVIYLVSLLLHELGHSAASIKFGADHSEIGFGFYLITPVLYANVTDVWRLKKPQRLIIDLAGVFMQFLVSCTGVVLYFFFEIEIIKYFALFVFLTSLVNLNPFLRFDGYWFLTDVTGTFNLRYHSDKLFFKFLRWLTGRTAWPLTSRENVWLFLYSCASWTFRIGFIFSVAWYGRHILTFPIYLPQKIINAFEHIRDFGYLTDIIMSCMLPGFFYFMIYKTIRDFYKHLKPETR